MNYHKMEDGGDCMKIAISVETAADLTKEIIDRYDIKVVPFAIQLGDKSCLDGEITTDDIISFVNENKVFAWLSFP